MKESIWYHSYYDEIWIRRSRSRIERGAQAVIKLPQYQFSVPDYLSLYLFKVDLKIWKYHFKKGWLIKLDDEI